MSSSTTQKAGYLTSMLIIGGLFFIFGFVTWLNSTLIPFLKLVCDLTDAQSYLVTTAFYIAYFFLAIPSSGILSRTGFKNGMALGLVVMAVGSLIFIPAASGRNYMLFLTGLFVQGAGLSLLQTASNPYISIIGPIESAARRISIMGICNKVAGVLSPIILGVVLLKDASKLDKSIQAVNSEIEKASALNLTEKLADLTSQKMELLNSLAQRVPMPYIVMAIVLVVVAILIQRSSLPNIDSEIEEGSGQDQSTKSSVFQFPHLLLGALCIFTYVGAEVMAGDIIGPYGKSMNIPLDQSKFFSTYTLSSMLLGYVIGIIAIPRFISQENSLKYGAIVGILFTLIAFFTHGYVSITFIALLGFANAPMWPAIFPLGIKGLGKFTKIGSAIMIMGIAGGAIIPLIYGALSERLGFQTAFMVTMVPCYLYVLYFAMRGHRVG